MEEKKKVKLPQSGNTSNIDLQFSAVENMMGKHKEQVELVKRALEPQIDHFTEVSRKAREQLDIIVNGFVSYKRGLQGTLDLVHTSHSIYRQTMDSITSRYGSIAMTQQAFNTAFSYGEGVLQTVDPNTLNRIRENLAIERSEVTLSMVDLKSLGIVSNTTQECGLTIDVLSIEKTVGTFNDVTLTTETLHKTDIGMVQLQTVQQMQWQLGNLETKMDELQRFHSTDSMKKDDMLEELMSYIKSGAECIVSLREIIFQKATSELVIDGHKIPLRIDSGEFITCQTLFSKEKKLISGWAVMDIAEKLGADVENIDNKEEIDKWISKVYQFIRHLNEKIERITRHKSFFIYSGKTIVLNPKFARTDK